MIKLADMVMGLFSDPNHADMAISDLVNAGIDTDDISVVANEDVRTQVTETRGSSTAAGATAGATTGAAVGGLAGLLVGIGAIAIPGIGALLIGGPIAAALGLTGAAATTVSGAVTGALAGGLLGALTKLGVPEERAQVYVERIKGGDVMLAVSTSKENDQKVRDILAKNQASEITSSTV